VVDWVFGSAQFGGDPQDAVDAGRLAVDDADARGQVRVRGGAGGPVGCGGFPVVIAGSGDFDDLAQPLHAVTALVVGDEPEAGSPARLPGEFASGIPPSTTTARTCSDAVPQPPPALDMRDKLALHLT
jgi:hypothetical protein